MEPDAIILAFSMLSSKPGFSLSFFTLINRLFSSSLLSAMRVVSSAYLRLLILLPAILIPACDSSNLACVLKRNYIQNALFIIHLINSNFFQNYNSWHIPRSVFGHQFCYFHILYLMFLTEEICLCAFIFTLYFSMPLTCILEKNISKDKFTVDVQEVPANEKREKQDIFESLLLSQLVFLMWALSCFCNSNYLSPQFQITSNHSLSPHVSSRSSLLDLVYLPQLSFQPSYDCGFVMLLIARLSHWNSLFISVVANWMY